MLPILGEHDLRDLINGIEADKVEQSKRSHRVAGAQLQSFVDVLDRRDVRFQRVDCVQHVRDEQQINNEAGTVLRANGLFAQGSHEVERRPLCLLAGRNRANDLHQLHQRHRVEEVETEHPVRATTSCGHRDNREARGIRSKNRIGPRKPI